MKRVKLLEDLFIISWLLIDTFWIFDQLILAIFSFMISMVFCCSYIVKLIDDNKEYFNALAALFWLMGNGFWVIQDLIPFIPSIVGKTSILLALLISIVLAFKNKLNNPKTNT